MPTVLNVRNIRIEIYPNDHPPPYVHAVRRDEARAKFELNCEGGPVVMVEQAGFRTVDIAAVGAAKAAALAAVCEQWKALHG